MIKNTITEVMLGGLRREDAPDYVDAFVAKCYVNGTPATKEQLDAINSDEDLRFELVQEWIN